MKRRIEGLHDEQRPEDVTLEGAFLVRVDRVFYRWHPERPFYVLTFAILEPSEHQVSRAEKNHTSGAEQN
jgi:hypothetical protein